MLIYLSQEINSAGWDIMSMTENHILNFLLPPIRLCHVN